MFSKLLTELRARDTNEHRQWKELVAQAAAGDEIGLAALETAAPGGLRGREAAEAFRQDVEALKAVADEEARLARADKQLSQIDVAKINAKRDKAAAVVAECEEQLSLHHRLSYHVGVGESRLDQQRGRSPRLWPELAPADAADENALTTLDDLARSESGEAQFVA